MSPSTMGTASEALNVLGRKLTRQGYRFVREPGRGELPAFLGDLQPDAIATGRSPNLLIEVLAGRGTQRADFERIDRIRRLLSEHPDWRLEVIHARAGEPPPEPVSARTVRKVFAEVSDLVEIDRRAALLLGWAALEATVRLLEPGLAAQALSSGSIIELLVGQGYLAQEEADGLRAVGRVRNGIAHGQLDLDVPSGMLPHLLGILDRLIAAADRRSGGVEAPGG